MTYVLRLFEVNAVQRAAFTSAFDYGGLWQEIASTLPGHLFTHLLKHAGIPDLYLAIEFWDTEEHFASAHESAQVLALHQWLRSSTRAHYSFGAFHFRSHDDGCSGQAAA